MHVHDAFVTAPIRAARRGLLARAVFGRIATRYLKDDSLAGRAAVLALTRRLGADIEPSASDSDAGREAGLMPCS